MKMPRRADFTSALDFAVALDDHTREEDVMYGRLLGMYDVVTPVSGTPEWVRAGALIRSVWREGDANPDDKSLELCLRALAQNILEDEADVIRLARGTTPHPETGSPMWMVWVELKPAEDAERAA